MGLTMVSASKNDLFGAKDKTVPDPAGGGGTDSTREQLEIPELIKIPTNANWPRLLAARHRYLRSPLKKPWFASSCMILVLFTGLIAPAVRPSVISRRA